MSPSSTPSVAHDAQSSSHLSYPTYVLEASTSASTSTISQPQSREILKNRLYVGNLHHTVDEHALIQIFSKYGKLSNLDYLFHKSGPLKGKPRGYAFVEYAEPLDADKALASAHNKLLRGRKLVVTYANQAPVYPSGPSSASGYRRNLNEAGRPTALSLLKSAGGREGGVTRTKDKIALMEAKLRQLEQPARPPPLPRSHALPPRPPAQQLHTNSHPSSAGRNRPSSSSTPLARSIPPRPSSSALKPPVSTKPPPLQTGDLDLAFGRSAVKATGIALKGVKIVRKKLKDKEAGDAANAHADEHAVQTEKET